MGVRAEVQVRVRVGMLAEAAAAKSAQVSTALLGGRRHVEQVTAQRPAQVFVKTGTSRLEDTRGKNSSITTFCTLGCILDSEE